MAPKRKLASVPDEPPATKRLRSRTVPTVSTPTEFDTAASRREQLKPTPRKARKEPTEAAASATINELEDISNIVQETPEVCCPPRPKTRVVKVPKSSTVLEVDSSLPNTESSPPLPEEPSARRQSRRGTKTVEVVIPTPKAPTKVIKRATSIRIPESPRATSTFPGSPVAAGLSKEIDITRDAHLVEATGILPLSLHSCFHIQKRAIMKMLQHPIYESDDPESANTLAIKQLSDLIDGTIGRAEGNSCLLLGPRGSGKSRMIDNCLDNLADKPVILRLSGWAETTDRHALREIAIQLLQQTGTSLLSETESDPVDPAFGVIHDEDNPFLDTPNNSNADFEHSTLSLPPSSHLHSLIPALLTLNRPVIVILDAFDLFALHPRQSLLYCLLDTVQNCRASSENRGIAVIGVTSRVDTIQLLEKRVKSRFSGRTIRTAPPSGLGSYMSFVRSTLLTLPSGDDPESLEEWNQSWASSVDQFLADKNVLNVLRETFSISREIKVISRILMNCVLRLNLDQPYLTHKILSTSTELQRSRPPDLHLGSLAYPSMCLLITSIHLETGGHIIFTFEMLFSIFRDQVRASTSAPVQVNGGSIGMVRCTREVLISAFEGLISARMFVHATGPSTNVGKEFMRYRCVVERTVVKKLVEQSGQVNLKKWLNKAQ